LRGLLPDQAGHREPPPHEFRERFAALNREPCSEDVWSRFVALVDEMTAEAAVIVKLPVRPGGGASGNRTEIDPTDAKGIQSLYKRNRRRAVRLILSGEGQSCRVAVQDVEDHFRGVWAPSTCDIEIFPGWMAVLRCRWARSCAPMSPSVLESSRTRRLGTTGSPIGTGRDWIQNARS